MTIVRSEKRKARKNHKCDLCFYTIKPNEVYDYQFNVDGGDKGSFKAHEDCIKLCNTMNLWEEDGLDGEIFHEIIDDKYYALTGYKEKMNFIDKLEFVKAHYKLKQKQAIIDIMKADEKDGLYNEE